MPWSRAWMSDLNLPIAAVAGLGAIFAAALARQTHALAPICGGAHCPACYVAAGLSAVALWRGAMSLRPRLRTEILS
jgi:hypothetical protein